MSLLMVNLDYTCLHRGKRCCFFHIHADPLNVTLYVTFSSSSPKGHRAVHKNPRLVLKGMRILDHDVGVKQNDNYDLFMRNKSNTVHRKI